MSTSASIATAAQYAYYAMVERWIAMGQYIIYICNNIYIYYIVIWFNGPTILAPFSISFRQAHYMDIAFAAALKTLPATRFIHFLRAKRTVLRPYVLLALLWHVNNNILRHLSTTYTMYFLILTDNSFFRLFGGDEFSADASSTLLLRLCADANIKSSLDGEFDRILSSSSDSNSSRRRLRLLLPSVFGDSHLDNEFGNIFETCVRTFPIIDWKENKE